MKNRFALAAIICIVMLATIVNCDNDDGNLPECDVNLDELVNDSTWTCIGLESETIEAIAVHPTNPDIIYAGSASDFSAGTVGGLFKSLSGGACWDTLIRGITVFDIDIHPGNPRIVYVTCGINLLTTPGILKTTNSGRSWQKVDDGIRITWEEGPCVLEINPQNPNILYVGTSGPFGGDVYKSTNGGHSWRAIGDDLLSITGAISIGIDPRHSNTVYVGTADVGAVCKSTNGGNTWQRLNFQEGSMVYDVLVHPQNSEIIYAGSGWYGFFYSTDGGTNWQSANNGLSDTTSVRQMIISNADVFYIAANNRREGLIYKSHQTDFNWQQQGIETFSLGVRSLAILPDKRLLVGTHGNGIFHILDHAASNE